MAWDDVFTAADPAAVKQRDVGETVWSGEWRRARTEAPADVVHESELYDGAEPWLTVRPPPDGAVAEDVVYSCTRRRAVWVEEAHARCCSSDEESDDDDDAAAGDTQLRVPLRKPTVLAREMRRMHKATGAARLHRGYGGTRTPGLLNPKPAPHPAAWRPPVLISLCADRLATALHDQHGDVEPLWLAVSCWTPSGRVCETFYTSFYSGEFRGDEEYDSRREPKGCLLHIPFDLFASSTPCYLLLKVYRLLTGDDQAAVTSLYRSSRPKAADAAKLKKKATECAAKGWQRRCELGWCVLPLCGGEVAWGDGSVRLVEVDSLIRSSGTTAPEWCLAEYLSGASAASQKKNADVPVAIELRVENVPTDAVHVHRGPAAPAGQHPAIRRCSVGGRVLVACAPQLPLPAPPPQQLRSELYVKMHALMLMKTKVMGTECRTFLVEVCVKATDNLRDPPVAEALLDRDGRGRVDRQYTSVSYHKKEAFFDDEFVVFLPGLAGEAAHANLHLFFTVYHVTFKSSHSKAERELIAVGHSMKMLARGPGCVVGDHTCHLPVLSVTGDDYPAVYDGSQGYFAAFRALEQVRRRDRGGDITPPAAGVDASVGLLDPPGIGRKLSMSSATSFGSGGGMSMSTSEPPMTKADKEAERATLQNFCEGGKRCLVLSLAARTTYHTVAAVPSQAWTPTSLFLLVPVGLSSTRFLHASTTDSDPLMELLLHLAAVARIAAAPVTGSPREAATPSPTLDAPPVRPAVHWEDEKDVDDDKVSAASVSSRMRVEGRSLRRARSLSSVSGVGSDAPREGSPASPTPSEGFAERNEAARALDFVLLRRLADICGEADALRWFPVLANQLLAVLWRVSGDAPAEQAVLSAFLDLLAVAAKCDDDAVGWYCDAGFGNTLLPSAPVPVWKVLLGALSRHLCDEAILAQLGTAAVHRRTMQLALRSYLLTIATEVAAVGGLVSPQVGASFAAMHASLAPASSFATNGAAARRLDAGLTTAADAPVFEKFAVALGTAAATADALPLGLATAWGEVLAEVAGVLGALPLLEIVRRQPLSEGSAVHAAAVTRALLGRVANPYPLLPQLAPWVVRIVEVFPAAAGAAARSAVVDMVCETAAVAIGAAAYDHEEQVLFAAKGLMPLVPRLVAMVADLREAYKEEIALSQRAHDKLSFTVQSMKDLARSTAEADDAGHASHLDEDGGVVFREDTTALATTIFEKQTALAECEERLDRLRRGETAEVRKLYAAAFTLVQCSGGPCGDDGGNEEGAFTRFTRALCTSLPDALGAFGSADGADTKAGYGTYLDAAKVAAFLAAAHGLGANVASRDTALGTAKILGSFGPAQSVAPHRGAHAVAVRCAEAAVRLAADVLVAAGDCGTDVSVLAKVVEVAAAAFPVVPTAAAEVFLALAPQPQEDGDDDNEAENRWAQLTKHLAVHLTALPPNAVPELDYVRQGSAAGGGAAAALADDLHGLLRHNDTIDKADCMRALMAAQGGIDRGGDVASPTALSD
eukprot:TRINITY_DN22137_c0_g1_i1.p1 TRINITY_DN22137_c0_g1~~TRINITY_DN22137_c0_g1_i1.p1  ORF type:complete len:1502 (+),score=509.63 TRINITY_DN22137_c0_g1_i1:52-4557(+)